MTFLQQPELSELEAMCPVWMPPSGEGMIEPIQTAPNVRKIESVQTKRHDTGNLWLHRNYRRYLKRYAVVRWIVLWMWRNGYPLYTKLSAHLYNRKVKRWRPLIKLSDSVWVSDITTYKLSDSTVVATPTPAVFPSCDQSYLVSPYEAIDKKFISLEFIHAHIESGYIRPSIMYQIEKKITDPILLPKEAIKLDKKFNAPYQGLAHINTPLKRTKLRIKAHMRNFLNKRYFQYVKKIRDYFDRS